MQWWYFTHGKFINSIFLFFLNQNCLTLLFQIIYCQILIFLCGEVWLMAWQICKGQQTIWPCYFFLLNTVNWIVTCTSIYRMFMKGKLNFNSRWSLKKNNNFELMSQYRNYLTSFDQVIYKCPAPFMSISSSISIVLVEAFHSCQTLKSVKWEPHKGKSRKQGKLIHECSLISIHSCHVLISNIVVV